MFTELLHALTTEHRMKLAERGIGSERLTEWRKGRRLPTEVQVADLADVTGVEWVRLQQEITVLRAPEERRSAIAKAIGARIRNS